MAFSYATEIILRDPDLLKEEEEGEGRKRGGILGKEKRGRFMYSRADGNQNSPLTFAAEVSAWSNAIAQRVRLSAGTAAESP